MEYDYFLNNKRKELSSDIRLLDNMSPLKVLQRGYSVVSNTNGTVNSIEQVNINDIIRITMSDGKIYANVTRKDDKNAYYRYSSNEKFCR